MTQVSRCRRSHCKRAAGAAEAGSSAHQSADPRKAAADRGREPTEGAAPAGRCVNKTGFAFSTFQVKSPCRTLHWCHSVSFMVDMLLAGIRPAPSSVRAVAALGSTAVPRAAPPPSALQTKIQGKLQQLEALQYQLTKQVKLCTAKKLNRKHVVHGIAQFADDFAETSTSGQCAGGVEGRDTGNIRHDHDDVPD